MQLSTRKTTWTEAELMSLPEVGGKYELVEGELLVTPARYTHEFITVALAAALSIFTRTHRLGRVGGSNLGYWMKNGNLRCPDASFVGKSRLKSMMRGSEGFLHGAPDLSVAVAPRSDTIKSLRKKAVEYLENGSKLVWIVNPEDQSVLVLRPDGSERVVTSTDSLDGEDVMPGFSLRVSELFEDWE